MSGVHLAGEPQKAAEAQRALQKEECLPSTLPTLGPGSAWQGPPAEMSPWFSLDQRVGEVRRRRREIRAPQACAAHGAGKKPLSVPRGPVPKMGGGGALAEGPLSAIPLSNQERGSLTWVGRTRLTVLRPATPPPFPQPPVCQEGPDPGSLKTYPGQEARKCQKDHVGWWERIRLSAGLGRFPASCPVQAQPHPSSGRRGAPCQLHPECVSLRRGRGGAAHGRADGRRHHLPQRPALRHTSLRPPWVLRQPRDFRGNSPGGSSLLLPCTPAAQAQR